MSEAAAATRRFGWCLDGNHAACRAEYESFTGGLRRCSCACHVGTA